MDFQKMNDFNVPIVYIDTAQELLVKQLFIETQVCSVKCWSPQHTHAPGAICVRSTSARSTSDECMCCYRSHQCCSTQETDVDHGSGTVH